MSHLLFPVPLTDNQLDVDADVVVKRGILGSGQGDILGNVLSSGPGHKGELVGDVLGVTGGRRGHTRIKHTHRQGYGHYKEDELLDADVDVEVDDLAIKRGYYDPDELMAEIEAGASSTQTTSSTARGTTDMARTLSTLRPLSTLILMMYTTDTDTPSAVS
jgi:hypothetical protein